jgi:hypothetical protein
MERSLGSCCWSCLCVRIESKPPTSSREFALTNEHKLQYDASHRSDLIERSLNLQTTGIGRHSTIRAASICCGGSADRGTVQSDHLCP